MEHYEESIAQKGHDVLLSCHNAATMKLCGNKCMKITREKTMLSFKWYQTFCSSICHEVVKKKYKRSFIDGKRPLITLTGPSCQKRLENYNTSDLFQETNNFLLDTNGLCKVREDYVAIKCL